MPIDHRTTIAPIRNERLHTAIAYALAITALFLFFISDALSKLFLFFAFDINRISVFVRSFYELLFLLSIIVFLTKRRLVFLLSFLIAFVFFAIGAKTFAARIPYPYSFLENILLFNKYYFAFIVFFALYRLPDNPGVFRRVIDAFEKILFINAIAVWVGFILQIGFLKTYIDQPYRYGFSGFIPAQNEATLFFFLSVSFFYYKNFILGQKSVRFWIVLTSALLLGTKGIYLFLALLLLFHFVTNAKLKAIITSTAFVFVLYLIVDWFLKTETAEILLSYFVSKAQDGGLISMILSNRDVTFETKVPLVMGYWTPLNYLFGGQDQTLYLIELDFVDLFLFLGIVGGAIYVALYFTSLFSFSLLRTFNLFFVACYFGLATFGGHFFYSAVNALYLCLFCLYIKASQKPLQAPRELPT